MKNTLIFILAALLSLSLAGCASLPIFSGAVTVAPSATATPVPQRGGTLTLYMPSNPDTLDPLLIQSSELASLLGMVYEPLVRVDETGFPAAYLAESWQVTDDGQGGFIWEFTLRDNVYFHNGGKIGAQDVIFTLNRISQHAQDCIYSGILDYVTDWEQTGERTFKLSANVRFGGLLELLTFPILCQAAYSGDEQTGMVGTGPYKVSSYDQFTGMELIAHASWWRKAPLFTAIKALPLADGDTALSTYAMHEMDMVPTMELSTSQYRNNAQANTLTAEFSTQYYEFLAPNYQSAAFSDKRMAQAVARLIDRTQIISRVYMNHALAVDTPVPPDSPFYDNTLATYSPDPDAAAELFAQMGYTDADGDKMLDKDGQALSLRILVNDDVDNSMRKEAAKLVAEQLIGAGVNATVEIKKWDEYQTALADGDFDMAMAGYYLERIPDFRFAFGSQSPIQVNISRYASAEMDTALLSIVNSGTTQELISAMSKWQQLFVSELPHIGLYFRTGTMLVRADIVGVENLRDRWLYRDIASWHFASQ